jgi:periplasmic divalent cation tolerance protein
LNWKVREDKVYKGCEGTLSMFVVISTFKRLKDAKVVANELVTTRLAACANIIRIQNSIYHWKGKIISESEWLLLLKTTKRKYNALEQKLRQLHSYENPEIAAFETKNVVKKYEKWVKAYCE